MELAGGRSLNGNIYCCQPRSFTVDSAFDWLNVPFRPAAKNRQAGRPAGLGLGFEVCTYVISTFTSSTECLQTNSHSTSALAYAFVQLYDAHNTHVSGTGNRAANGQLSPAKRCSEIKTKGCFTAIPQGLLLVHA